MNRAAHRLFAAVVMAGLAPVWLSAQVNVRPTAPPTVTAENEAWYRTGEPIAFAGNTYYPTGPATHFLADEMVRSGFYKGIPLYSRTTIEPYSVVFVPIDGGRMQPYERRRAGELAGTSGSTVAALPVEIPSATVRSDFSPSLQAPAPPFAASPSAIDEPPPAAEVTSRPAAATPAVPIATTGRAVRPASSARARVRREAANAIFVEFDNAKWFSSGPPLTLDLRSLTRVGERGGFPVYRDSRGTTSTIYIPIAQGVDALAPYSRRK
jgi:hypothetical protein